MKAIATRWHGKWIIFTATNDLLCCVNLSILQIYESQSICAMLTTHAPASCSHSFGTFMRIIELWAHYFESVYVRKCERERIVCFWFRIGTNRFGSLKFSLNAVEWFWPFLLRLNTPLTTIWTVWWNMLCRAVRSVCECEYQFHLSTFVFI